MLLAAIQKVSLFHLLHEIDVDLADGAQSQGCPHCGGPFHGLRPRFLGKLGPVSSSDYLTLLTQL